MPQWRLLPKTLDKHFSIEEINDETGIREGDGEKLRPFLRTFTSGLQREVFDRLTTHHFSITFNLRSKLLETSLSNLDFCQFLQSVVSAAKASSCSDVNERKSVSEIRPDKTGVQLSLETGDGPMVETYLCAERL